MIPIKEKLPKHKRKEIAVGKENCEIVKEAALGAQPLYIGAKHQLAH